MRALFLAFALVACGVSQGPEAPNAGEGREASARAAGSGGFRADRLSRAAAGTAAPDLALETGPDGATETLSDIMKANPGVPVLVNLWATWCAPCLKELPSLDGLAAGTKGRLVVVPVSQDLEGWKAVSPAFTAAKFPNLATRVESQMAFGAAVGAKGLPLSILYGPDGRELWRYAGDLDWESSEAREILGV
jgi:thiol-disulfide isomerase/thioredoxin